MAFLKHIGKHGDRKVAVIFRQIPGDDHMCLVLYPELLPSHMHDALMKVLESPVGQSTEELADALHRNLFPDGRNMLETLHAERMMKRVNTEQVLITPTLNSNVKLSELNQILNEMKLGESAIRRLSEIDANTGLVDAKTKRAAEQKFKSSQQQINQRTPDTARNLSSDSLLGDRELAADLMMQAERMFNEGNSLLKESARLRKEAEQLDPQVPAKSVVMADRTEKTQVKPVAKKGRPARVKAQNA